MALMKTPINCPFCGDILRSDFITSYENISVLEKKCDKKLNHKITFRALTNNEDYVRYICIPISKDVEARWYFSEEFFDIVNHKTNMRFALPWFNPDISNYNKLINKIQTYILFS